MLVAGNESRSATLGRTQELDTLAAILDQAVDAVGGAILLHGEPGIGKTRLLGHMRGLAAQRGMRILACSGCADREELALCRAAPAALAGTSRGGPDSPGQADLLRAALGLNPSLVADLYRAALAVLELLATVGAQTPLLVIADDAHWLDRPSADVLAFIGRRIEAEPIALAVALRDSLPDPFTAAQLPKLVLAGLDPGSASALLAEVAPSLPVEVRERLLADAAGNPQPTPARSP